MLTLDLVENEFYILKTKRAARVILGQLADQVLVQRSSTKAHATPNVAKNAKIKKN